MKYDIGYPKDAELLRQEFKKMANQPKRKRNIEHARKQLKDLYRQIQEYNLTSDLNIHSPSEFDSRI